MMSFAYDTIWPLRLDLSPLECRQILREKELLCYSDVVSVLRAQGPLSEEKKSLLINLQKIFTISDERNKAELRRAANNEELATISEKISGFDAYAEWAALGALKMPSSQRPIPRTIFCDEGCQTVAIKKEFENNLPQPLATSDIDLSKKLEDSISTNRNVSKDLPTLKVGHNNVLNHSTGTNTEVPTDIVKKDGVTSLDYNLHLLSEIATGESSKSIIVSEPTESEIKPDTFSIHNQIEEIGLPIISESSVLSQSAFLSTNNIPSTTLSSNVLFSTSNMKTLTNTGHDPSLINMTGNVTPMLIGGNNAGHRYVLPRNAISQGINLIATNHQRQQIPGYMTQQQIASSNYFTLANNQIRSPPSHQIATTWSNQPQAQHVFIQNVSSAHHGLGIQHGIGHQTTENLTSLGYTLQQRAVRAEQHQTNNKHNFIVRNLGSQSSMDSERNKRFMVVKGGSSLGPSTKKPKISNPSNRQPGRPPLMPAPSSAYTSRPYVANEIFHSNRTSSSVTSSSGESSLIEANGLKISPSINRPMTTSSSQMKSNSYSTNHGNNGSKRANSAPIVQLGSGSSTRTPESPVIGSGTSNTLRPKNIQPVISVVPLSPREAIVNDSLSSPNISTSATFVKEENIELTNAEKDSISSVRVMSKDEVYANIMERVNPIVSTIPTQNKTQ